MTFDVFVVVCLLSFNVKIRVCAMKDKCTSMPRMDFMLLLRQRYVQLFINFILFHFILLHHKDKASYCLDMLILVREKIRVPGEKPSKHRTDQLWELNSKYQVWLYSMAHRNSICGLCCTVHNVTHSSFFTVNSIDILKLQ